MDLRQEWSLYETENVEGEIRHRPLSVEDAFWHAVSVGDLDYVRQNCSQKEFLRTGNNWGVGKLSGDPLTNLKYHFVITAALITRKCVENGMEMELAFRLSDFYISRQDVIHTVEGIVELHDEMVLDFTGKMRLLAQKPATSKPVTACIEYIYVNIQKRISVDDLAAHTGLSSCYLSRLFKTETGVSISDYIREKKTEKAKELLRFSNFSLIEVANYLSFYSQSHFTRVFRELTGMTPKKYRDACKEAKLTKTDPITADGPVE